MMTTIKNKSQKSDFFLSRHIYSINLFINLNLYWGPCESTYYLTNFLLHENRKNDAFRFFPRLGK